MSKALAMSKSILRAGRLCAFANDNAARRAGKWAKAALFGSVDAEAWCARNGLALTRAANEGTNTAGGFLVPDEIMQAVINLRETYGALRATAQIVPMASDTMSAARRTSGLTVYFLPESTAPSESQPAFDNVNLVAKKLASLTKASSEIDEDSEVDIGELLTSELAYAFALKEDQCAFLGDGSSTYGGIRGITTLLIDGNHNAGKVVATAGHDLFTEIDTVDLANLMAALPAFAMPGAKWFISQYGFATVFCRLAAVSGGIVARTDFMGRNFLTFLGFEVVLTQVLPQTNASQAGNVMLAFGDMSRAAMIGDRRTVTMKRSNQRYLDSDQIGFMGTERVDIVVHSLGDNTTAGPIVGLIGG